MGCGGFFVFERTTVLSTFGPQSVRFTILTRLLSNPSEHKGLVVRQVKDIDKSTRYIDEGNVSVPGYFINETYSNKVHIIELVDVSENDDSRKCFKSYLKK